MQLSPNSLNKYNRSSIKGDENFHLLTLRKKNLKYNRSSIKGDENRYCNNWHIFSLLFKYNRSSIKGDENSFRSVTCSSIASKIQPLLDKRGRERCLVKILFHTQHEIQPLLDKRGREHLANRLLSYINRKYNRSSIKGDENFKWISLSTSSP